MERFGGIDGSIDAEGNPHFKAPKQKTDGKNEKEMASSSFLVTNRTQGPRTALGKEQLHPIRTESRYPFHPASRKRRFPIKGSPVLPYTLASSFAFLPSVFSSLTTTPVPALYLLPLSCFCFLLPERGNLDFRSGSRSGYCCLLLPSCYFFCFRNLTCS